MPFFDHYPYTNFHNVNLDWVLQAVKSWGALVEQNNQNFINLAAANESFKEYVTGYITNLDVQEEINNKLDAMLEDGTLTEYLDPYISSDVSEWLAEHITPTSPALDDTLTVHGAAAEAYHTGEAIKSIVDSLRVSHVFTKGELISGTFDTDGLLVENSTKVRVKGFYKVYANDEFIFTAGSLVTDVRYGFYTNDFTYSNITNWRSGDNTYVTPNDGYVVIVFQNSGGGDIDLSSFDASLNHRTLHTGGMPEGRNGDVISPGWKSGNHFIAGYGSSDGLGNVGNTQNMKCSNFIDVKNYKMFILNMPITSHSLGLTDSGFTGLAFYDSKPEVIYTSFVPSFWNRSGDSHTALAKIYVPSNAKYLRLSYWNDDYVAANCPTELFTCTAYVDIPNIDEMITHDCVMCDSIQNVVRRARQLTDIKWTPVMDIPRYSMVNPNYSGEENALHFLDWFKAGNTYKGIPYSGSGSPDAPPSITPAANRPAAYWGYYYMYVGVEMDLETFMTAIRTGNSMMASKSTQETFNYDSSPYGSVCNALVGYALDKHAPLTIVNNFCNNNQGFLNLGTFETMANIDIVRIGDVIKYAAYHIAIITDIIRDPEGHITDLEVSEATTTGNGNNSSHNGESQFGGVCRRKFYTLDEFRDWFRLYTLYRYRVINGIPYTASDYVNTGNEGDANKIVDMPCVPYLGNKARYKMGRIPNTTILINAEGFTTLHVLKDGSAFNDFDITGLDAVDVGFSAAGTYTAYMTGSNNIVSRSCEWYVVPMDYT